MCFAPLHNAPTWQGHRTVEIESHIENASQTIRKLDSTLECVCKHLLQRLLFWRCFGIVLMNVTGGSQVQSWMTLLTSTNSVAVALASDTLPTDNSTST